MGKAGLHCVVRFCADGAGRQVRCRTPTRSRAACGAGGLERGLTYSAIMPATDRPTTIDRCRGGDPVAADAPDEVIVIDSPRAWAQPRPATRAPRRPRDPFLVFVDSDVVVHPDAFTRIRAAFDADPELAAIFGSYDDLPSLHGAVSTFRNMLHHYVHQAPVVSRPRSGRGSERCVARPS